MKLDADLPQSWVGIAGRCREYFRCCCAVGTTTWPLELWSLTLLRVEQTVYNKVTGNGISDLR